MRDRLQLEEWPESEFTASGSSLDATLRFATALVQDGISGVTIVVPRRPGILARARAAAESARVSVVATEVGSVSITMRFSGVIPQRG